ncbi:MAG: tRNA pseudouridine(55) synthase TruB [Acidimicrobiales bacterium]
MTAGSSPGPTGMVVVDKEPGWTSHDVVARCRRIFGQRRVGHAGTLDPDATGVLLVGLGRFTRMLRFLSGLPKTYQGEVVLGTSTTTLDASGDVVREVDMSHVAIEEVRTAAATLTGRIMQVPPMVSARKVDGRRLYQLARQGVEVEREARAVTVHRFDVCGEVAHGVFAVEVECSTGTYVRTLAADLGEALGGAAHLRGLRRTRIGSFSDADAHRLEELVPAHLCNPAQALRDLPQLEVDPEAARMVSHGLALDKVAIGAAGEGPWAILDRRGRLLAVYEGTDTDRMVAACVLETGG